jgi:hypothetical protein
MVVSSTLCFDGSGRERFLLSASDSSTYQCKTTLRVDRHVIATSFHCRHGCNDNYALTYSKFYCGFPAIGNSCVSSAVCGKLRIQIRALLGARQPNAHSNLEFGFV